MSASSKTFRPITSGAWRGQVVRTKVLAGPRGFRVAHRIPRPVAGPGEATTYQRLLPAGQAPIVINYERKFNLLNTILEQVQSRQSSLVLCVIATSTGSHGDLPALFWGANVVVVQGNIWSIARYHMGRTKLSVMAILRDSIRCDPVEYGHNDLSLSVLRRPDSDSSENPLYQPNTTLKDLAVFAQVNRRDIHVNGGGG